MQANLRHFAVIIAMLLITLLAYLLFIAGYNDNVIGRVFGVAAMIISLACIILFRKKGVK